MTTRCRNNNRPTARERLAVIDCDRIASKVARDTAKHVARISTGADVLPTGHAELRQALRETIAEQLRVAQEQV